MNGVKPAKISSRHLYQTHTAAGVWQWFLARGRVGRAMWTQRTGGGLWNCRLSRKNKRPAVGARRWAGGKRQLEGSPTYRAAKRLSCGLETNSRLHWFGLLTPKIVLPPFSITPFHTCIKVITKGCVSVCKQRFPSPYYRCPFFRRCATELELCVREGKFLWFTASYNKLSFFFFPCSNGHSMKPELQKHGSNICFINQFKYRTQQPVMHVDFLSGLVQFQIN